MGVFPVVIFVVVAVPVLVLAFVAVRRRKEPGERPAVADEASRARDERAFADAERYEEEWCEEQHRHPHDPGVKLARQAATSQSNRLKEAHVRFLIIATPRTTPPPEIVPGLIERGEAWHQRYEDRFESFRLFVGGGGFGVATVNDEAELHRMMAEMPFSMFSDVQVRPFVDAATGWRQAKEAVAGMMAAA